MSKLANPCQIARHALEADGLAHEPVTYLISSEETQCMFCGHTIHKGDPCNEWSLPPCFNDGAYLKARHTARVCEHCSVVAINESKPKNVGGKLLSKGKFCVYSGEGTRRVIHKDALAYSLINPPEPPFVFTQGSTKKGQHVIWKAPVSLSKDYYFIQFGNQTLSIRRERMIEGSEAMRRLKELMEENGISVGKSKNPAFVNTDIELKQLEFGLIREDVYALGRKNNKVQACLDTITQLKTGELWGAFIITAFEPNTDNMTKLDLEINP